LSDSQAFRLTVARAIVRAPGIVAVDADLSAVDQGSLTRILRVLAAPDAPWTLLVVSEHPLVLEHCDCIVELREGEFVHVGGTR
jgi:ABC-type multidrug transport system fused ATPase/permease subunit